MRILIDIGHPAHVHLFKNLAYEMKGAGHDILFTCREKEFEINLLEHYELDYRSFGKKYSSIPGKLLGMIEFDVKEFIAGLKFRPDILLSHGSIYAAHASFLLGKPHISLEDSGNMEQIRLYKPFTKVIITPDVLKENLGKKQIRYRSYHELAYLHPDYYKPDDSVYNDLKIAKDERFCIIRFVSWKATHDEGQKGFSDSDKRQLVKLLRNKMKVFITSESDLPVELKQFQICISPEKIHDALYFASLVISEGATIASEAGVLGTTSFYVNSIRRSYCEDQERFGLVFNYQNPPNAIFKIMEIISDNNKLIKQQESREKLLKEKINTTVFLVWFVQNWPESFKIMKENPDYQYRFR